jgi:hypothetical protein
MYDVSGLGTSPVFKGLAVIILTELFFLLLFILRSMVTAGIEVGTFEY